MQVEPHLAQRPRCSVFGDEQPRAGIGQVSGEAIRGDPPTRCAPVENDHRCVSSSVRHSKRRRASSIVAGRKRMSAARMRARTRRAPCPSTTRQARCARRSRRHGPVRAGDGHEPPRAGWRRWRHPRRPRRPPRPAQSRPVAGCPRQRTGRPEAQAADFECSRARHADDDVGGGERRCKRVLIREAHGLEPGQSGAALIRAVTNRRSPSAGAPPRETQCAAPSSRGDGRTVGRTGTRA